VEGDVVAALDDGVDAGSCAAGVAAGSVVVAVACGVWLADCCEAAADLRRWRGRGLTL
jgi:hypothetical protein